MYVKVKGFLDFVISFCVVLVFWWLFVIIALFIKLEDGGSILFKQRRIGIHKKEFFIYKFRTMKTNTPKNTPTHLLDDPERYITKTGRFLRKASLDELPQLFNILLGQMSIVGPRPALYNQYDLIEERDKYGANDITPGLTGWAQINGRDELPINIKAELDGEYVKKMSFFFDVKIIIKTVFSVFKAEGISEGRHESNNNR